MPRLDDMAEPELRELMQGLAMTVSDRVPEGTKFFVLCQDPGEGRQAAEFVGNMDFGAMPDFLRDALDQLEGGNFVDRGEAPDA